jgi:serine/threonine protein kinase
LSLIDPPSLLPYAYAKKKEQGMSDDLMLGRKIKGYQIAEVLGRGGMGCVYRAQHPLIGKQVAIKVLQGFQSPAVISRFVLEAKAVNDIRHENLIDILDFDELEEGNPYIIMEYLEGRSLDDAIHEGPFPLAQLGHIGLQLCSALYAAHEKGIVHRDLKGDNIFLINRANQQNFVKVLDFGIAKLLDVSDEKRHRTEANSILGTPLYMSPEQITGQPVDARTDIYALGVLLYQMATGYPPFNDPSPMVLLAMHVTAPPPPPSHFAPDLSAALEAVILRCLQKDPMDRYESMSQLATALGEACHIEPALYLGKVMMSMRLSTPEATATPKRAAFFDSPTELRERPEVEDLKATMPAMPMVDESLLLPPQYLDLENTSPNAAPEAGWRSIDQLIASIDAREDASQPQDARPTTEMTREELLLLTTGQQLLTQKLRPPPKPAPKPQPFPVLLLLISLLLLGGGFAVWFFLLQ